MGVAWVHRALHWRLASYRYALERLVIAVPSGRAVEAERALARFQAIVLQVDPALARCAGAVFSLPSLPPGWRRSSRNRKLSFARRIAPPRARAAPWASGRA